MLTMTGSIWVFDQFNRTNYVFVWAWMKWPCTSNLWWNFDSYGKEVSRLAGSLNQLSADNVDHIVRPIDGKGSLHSMSILTYTTSKVSSEYITSHPPIMGIKIEEGRCDQTRRHPNKKLLDLTIFTVYNDHVNPRYHHFNAGSSLNLLWQAHCDWSFPVKLGHRHFFNN